MKKIAAPWLSLLFLFTFVVIIYEIAPPVRATTIYVDDSGGADYKTIQEGIDATIDGDTVFVYSGTYYENIMIDKTIDLIGEDRNTTIIDGGENGHVVRIIVNWVNITGFNVTNSDEAGAGFQIESSYNDIFCNNIWNNSYGIYIDSSTNNMLRDNNIIANSRQGIYLPSTSNFNTISGNYILNNDAGIDLRQSSNDNLISDNMVFNNDYNGISISQVSSENRIMNNSISGNGFSGISISWSSSNNYIINNSVSGNNVSGISLGLSSYIGITGNNIMKNPRGLNLEMSSNNNISLNNINSNDECGLYLTDSTDNTIYHNNFFDNSNHAYQNTNVGNIWDDGYPSGGNYWSDWTTPDNNSGPNQDESWSDGIVDNPRSVDGALSLDNYPITTPSGWPGHIPEGPVYNTNTGKYFNTIQASIYDLETIDGNIIMVSSGTYIENIVVNKSLTLIGTNKNSTIIDGNEKGHVIEIKANWVNITGFMIRNSGDWPYAGIEFGSNYNNITNNNISLNIGMGIYTVVSSNNIISGNIISMNNRGGIYLLSANNNTIRNNNIYSNNWSGINLCESSNNIILNNSISNNSDGSYLTQSSCNNTISNNIIYSNYHIGVHIGNGIHISVNSDNNTISYNFILNNGKVMGGGIYLSGTSNNYFFNNSFISNRDYGISMESSSNIFIYNNTISYSFYGIQSSDSDNTTIFHNIISFNSGTGIEVVDSKNDDIFNNIIDSNGYYSIALGSSKNVMVTNNTMNENGIIIGGDLDEWNSHIIENNSVFGKPIYYYKNMDGINVPNNIAQVILANCTNFTIQELNFQDVCMGILLGFSNYNNISNNQIIATIRHGIYLSRSKFNNIYNNLIEQSKGTALNLYYSSYNNIYENTLTNNNLGVYLDRSTYNSIYYNNLSSNWFHGIYLYDRCDYNNIYRNDISMNDHEGIDIRYSSFNNISENIISFNNESGVYIHTQYFPSIANNISNNFISSNNGEGILLWPQSNWHIIRDNTISNNEKSGLNVSHSNNNTVFGNIFNSNKLYGIYLHDSEDIVIYHNNFTENTYQVYDDGKNVWNISYPYGGNYWNDYIDVDEYKGIKQDIDGEDGIYDNPYIIDLDSRDNYPLMHPWVPDNSPPIIELISPLNNSVLKPGVIIDLSISDPRLDIVTYRLNGGLDQVFQAPFDIDTISWLDGINMIEIHAEDLYYNTNITWYNFSIDSSPPEINLNLPQNNSIIKAGVIINISLSELHLDKVQYSINGEKYELLLLPFDINTSSWEDGNYTIMINATDIAGNFNITRFNFTIDSTSPEITLFSPENNSFIVENMEINLTILDANLDKVTYSINGETAETLYYPYNINTSSWIDGNYTIIIYADDMAGNFNERFFNLIKDTISPEISLNSPDNESLLMEASILDFEVTDSNLNSVRYSINQAPPLNFETPFDLDTTNWEDGDYLITIRAEDSAGHISVEWFLLKVDTQEPSIVLTSIVDGQTDVSVEPEIVIEFSEPMDIDSVKSSISIIPDVECSYLWSNSNRTLTLNFSEPLEYETLYKITIGIDAKDTAGKELETEFEIEFTTQKMPKSPDKDEGFPIIYLALILIIAIVVAIIIVILVMAKKKIAVTEVIGTGEIVEAQIEEIRTFQIRCSNCNNLLTVMDTGTTQNVSCPFCNTLLTVGSGTGAAKEPTTQSEALTEPQPEPQPQAQHPTIKISCPKCSHKFSIVKTEGVMKVQCPNCGAKGSLG